MLDLLGHMQSTIKLMPTQSNQLRCINNYIE